jgi:hypothetical protein
MRGYQRTFARQAASRMGLGLGLMAGGLIGAMVAWPAVSPFHTEPDAVLESWRNLHSLHPLHSQLLHSLLSAQCSVLSAQCSLLLLHLLTEPTPASSPCVAAACPLAEHATTSPCP